jgi:hypothetical protein
LFLHPKDGSGLFNEDSTFQPYQNGNKVGMSFFVKSDVLNGWIPLEGWCESIAIGADGFMCCVNAPGNAFIKWNVNRTWEFAGGGLKSIDCGNTYAVFGTFLDGTVRQYRGGGNWERRGANANVAHTAVAANGTYATMIDKGNGQFTFENYGRPPINCLWISLGPTQNDAALVTPDRKVFLMNAKNPQGRTVENPPGGLQFAKAFMSKNDSNEVLAVTTSNRIFAIDASYMWSEIPNPQKLSYFGVNKDLIVGCIQGLSPQGNIYRMVVKPAEQIPSGFKEAPYSFNNGGPAVPFTQKGLGQVARECKESPKCVGFNYGRNGIEGNFVMGLGGSEVPNNGMSYYKKDSIVEALVRAGTILNYDKCVTNGTVYSYSAANKLPGDDGALNKTRYSVCAPYYNNPGWKGGADTADDRKSIFVEAGPKKVIFYSGPNFTGKATEIDIGDYPRGKPDYANDSLQSVKVPLGLAVIMWEHGIGEGREVR